MKRAYVSFKTGNIYVLGDGSQLHALQKDINDGDGMFIVISSDRMEAMRYIDFQPVKFFTSDVPRRPLRLHEQIKLLKISLLMGQRVEASDVVGRS